MKFDFYVLKWIFSPATVPNFTIAQAIGALAALAAKLIFWLGKWKWGAPLWVTKTTHSKSRCSHKTISQCLKKTKKLSILSYILKNAKECLKYLTFRHVMFTYMFVSIFSKYLSILFTQYDSQFLKQKSWILTDQPALKKTKTVNSVVHPEKC